MAGVLDEVLKFHRLNVAALKATPGQEAERDRLAAEARAGTRLYSARSLTVLLSRSPEWRSITARDRDKLGLVTRDQGEFW